MTDMVYITSDDYWGYADFDSDANFYKYTWIVNKSDYDSLDDDDKESLNPCALFYVKGISDNHNYIPASITLSKGELKIVGSIGSKWRPRNYKEGDPATYEVITPGMALTMQEAPSGMNMVEVEEAVKDGDTEEGSFQITGFLTEKEDISEVVGLEEAKEAETMNEIGHDDTSADYDATAYNPTEETPTNYDPETAGYSAEQLEASASYGEDSAQASGYGVPVNYGSGVYGEEEGLPPVTLDSETGTFGEDSAQESGHGVPEYYGSGSAPEIPEAIEELANSAVPDFGVHFQAEDGGYASLPLFNRVVCLDGAGIKTDYVLDIPQEDGFTPKTIAVEGNNVYIVGIDSEGNWEDRLHKECAEVDSIGKELYNAEEFEAQTYRNPLTGQFITKKLALQNFVNTHISRDMRGYYRTGIVGENPPIGNDIARSNPQKRFWYLYEPAVQNENTGAWSKGPNIPQAHKIAVGTAYTQAEKLGLTAEEMEIGGATAGSREGVQTSNAYGEDSAGISGQGVPQWYGSAEYERPDGSYDFTEEVNFDIPDFECPHCGKTCDVIEYWEKETAGPQKEGVMEMEIIYGCDCRKDPSYPTGIAAWEKKEAEEYERPDGSYDFTEEVNFDIPDFECPHCGKTCDIIEYDEARGSVGKTGVMKLNILYGCDCRKDPSYPTGIAAWDERLIKVGGVWQKKEAEAGYPDYDSVMGRSGLFTDAYLSTLKKCKGKRKDGSDCQMLMLKSNQSNNCGHCDVEIPTGLGPGIHQLDAETFYAPFGLASRKETEKRFGKDLAKSVHTLGFGPEVKPSHFCECGNELTIHPVWDKAESRKLGKESLKAECEKCGWTGVVQRADAESEVIIEDGFIHDYVANTSGEDSSMGAGHGVPQWYGSAESKTGGTASNYIFDRDAALEREMAQLSSWKVGEWDSFPTLGSLYARRNEIALQRQALAKVYLGAEMVMTDDDFMADDMDPMPNYGQDSSLIGHGVPQWYGSAEDDHKFTTKERIKLARKGQAMPIKKGNRIIGGRYPIRNKQDLSAAIQAIGRAKYPGKTRKWIKKRAKQLGAAQMIPSAWGSETQYELGLPIVPNTEGGDSALGSGRGVPQWYGAEGRVDFNATRGIDTFVEPLEELYGKEYRESNKTQHTIAAIIGLAGGWLAAKRLGK